MGTQLVTFELSFEGADQPGGVLAEEPRGSIAECKDGSGSGATRLHCRRPPARDPGTQ
jgi:hypothetical protein